MVGPDLNLRQSAPCWGLEGGESHVGEAFDSGLVSRYRCDVGRPSGLEDRVLGQLGRGRDCFPHSFGSVIRRGSQFLLANVCLCGAFLHSMLSSDMHIEQLQQKQREEG